MILITGCNGLIGSFITRNLLSKKYYIRALKRPSGDLSLIGDVVNKIDWVEGDVTDINILEKSLKGIETVIHCAALVSFSSQDRKKLFKINAEGTANIINASLNRGVKEFIHISSVAALGRKKNLTHINENSVWENSDYNTNYAISKYQAELEAWRGMEEGLNVTVLNPSVVLGPGDWEKGSTKIFQYVWNQGKFYSEKKLNFVDVRDISDVVEQLVANEKAYGKRFILNGGQISYKDFFDKVANNFNKKAPYIKAKPWLGELAWRLGALKTFFTGKPSLITKETVKLSQQNFSYDNSKICDFLNFHFRTADETINWVCRELRKKYNV
jgi:nucleoside-diphosphate-sugar epimerase